MIFILQGHVLDFMYITWSISIINLFFFLYFE